MERLLDAGRIGPLYLSDARIAQLVVDALHHGERSLRHYELHAWVVMSNHVHLLATPEVELARLTRSLKGITAKRANAVLGTTEQPFWQDESYDHVVRSAESFDQIRSYIERDPVRAGLVGQPEDWAWSSANPRWGEISE